MDSSGAQSQSFLIPVLLPIPSWVGQALSPLAWATSGITSGEAAAGRLAGRGPPLDSHIRFSEPRGRARGAPGAPGAWQRPFRQPRGPRTSCVTSGPVDEVFSLSMSPPPGLQVGLSPLAGFLHHFSTEAPLSCPPASSGLASLESPWAEG